MKILAALIVMILVVALGLAGALFFTGNLNEKGMAKLLGNAAPDVKPKRQAASGDANLLMTALREKEKDLIAREQDLKISEQRAAVLKQELEMLRDSLRKVMSDVNAKLDLEDDNYAQSLKTVADSLAEMDSDLAAKALISETWTIGQAAKVLMLIENEKARSDILNELGPEDSGKILQQMKARKFGGYE